ncbi:MAG: sigma-54-dependent Fis family transcriptional regulator, partial [Planctomycetes bacterium]|nr:sigma-54-dependent Fis family transcriptional regulator [Planctomycetota bacterium]
VGKKVHVVIYCDRVGRKDRYQRSDLQYLCSVAAQVAVAMENIRAYEDVADRARSLESEVEGQYNLVGQSPEIKEVFEFIRKAAPTDAGVLICGESGTGKELVARAIHYNSKRGDGPFEAVNCAAMSQTLIESELFGHLKGSFTGAVNDRPGRFELAHEGTIFLDEIGALPLECQTKLLRVLEMGTLRRVGDVKDRKVDVRVIAATNEDLDKAKEEGSFREDLFYRLDVLRADLPTLRDRGDDIELLAQHFLREFSEKTGRTIRGFDPEVLNVFRDYRWPGNVRELKNVVERMVIMCEDDVLGPDLLPAELRGRQAVAIPQPGGEKMPEALESLGELEKNYIKEVLRKTDGNKKKTAEILGIDRSTLYAKLKKYAEED